MKWIAFPLALVVIAPLYAHAALVVTKVMSNPDGVNAGRQWIEVTNNGADPIDLGAKDIRLFTTSGNHLIKAYAGSNTILSAGSTGIIAQNPMSFLFDKPDYAGELFKSSFTLPASGVVGITQTDGTVLARKAYVAIATLATKKPASTSKSTTKRATTRTTSSSKSQLKASKTNSYGKGTVAPAASADAEAAGAVFALPPILAILAQPFIQAAGTLWFSLYLALMAFSGFSLIVIQRHYYV